MPTRLFSYHNYQLNVSGMYSNTLCTEMCIQYKKIYLLCELKKKIIYAYILTLVLVGEALFLSIKEMTL